MQQEQRQAQDVPAASTRSKRRCSCCCSSHCKFSFHTMGPDVRAYTSTRLVPLACELGDVAVDMEVLDKDTNRDYIDEEKFFTEADSINKMMKSLNIEI